MCKTPSHAIPITPGRTCTGIPNPLASGFDFILFKDRSVPHQLSLSQPWNFTANFPSVPTARSTAKLPLPRSLNTGNRHQLISAYYVPLRDVTQRYPRRHHLCVAPLPLEYKEIQIAASLEIDTSDLTFTSID